MKKLLLSAFALFGCLAASAADEALNLTMKDGSVHSFVLAEKPVITMGDGKLNVATDKATATYDLHEVSHYVFGEASTGIKGVGASAGVARQGDNIVFRGVKADRVAVSTLGGAAVSAAVSATEDGTSVSLSNLPSGVYIIKVAGTTVKVSKK